MKEEEKMAYPEEPELIIKPDAPTYIYEYMYV